MRRFNVSIAAILALLASTGLIAQSDVDRAFTAAGKSCDQITWSREALEQFPNIASACQDVMERDGKYYVKFSGTVRRVTDRGRNVTIDFQGGSELALTPPENMSLYIDGRPREPSSLRRGDELTFYVPQDRLAAPAPAVVGVTVIPLTRIRVAQVAGDQPAAAQEEPAQEESGEDALPHTASAWPLLGLGGLALMSLGAMLTVRRRRYG